MTTKIIHPLTDRVVVSIGTTHTTTSGIIVPESIETERPEQGTVLAIGKDCKEVQVGDIVVFAKYGPEIITVDGGDYYILREDQILAIIK